MLNLNKALNSRLNNAKRIAFLGMGSEVRADDAVGIVICEALKSFIRKNKIKECKVFLGYTAPENLTGEIKKFNPTHLLVLDALDFNSKPGEVKIISSQDETATSFSTHKMPLGVFEEYLNKSILCEIIVIGIQPKSLEFCFKMSREILTSSELIVQEIENVLVKFNKMKR